jgi:hypothetical protein
VSPEVDESDFITLTRWAAWGASGLPADVFDQLVRDLESTEHAVRSGNQITFANAETAALVLRGGGRRRRPRRFPR